MGRAQTKTTRIRPESVQAYLRATGYADAEVTSMVPLGMDTQEGLKGYGYGRPLHVTFMTAGRQESLVVRTMSPDPFGHDRRADRVDALVLAFDTFNEVPRHIRARDMGTFNEQGALVPMAEGEPFLITNYVEGELYAHDLRQMQALEIARAQDLERAEALADYLVDLHRSRVDPATYARALRDTLGSGEGIFGQTDAYPLPDSRVDAQRLIEIELHVVRWRWQLKKDPQRACRTHGDFHPFNVLFRQGADFSVLDCSRGGQGEAADDVVSMAVNYLFFALASRGELSGALRQVWQRFWQVYLERSQDNELLGCVAPFFAWRLLVLANPVWYPDLAPSVRECLLGCAEKLLGGAPFSPESVDGLLG